MGFHTSRKPILDTSGLPRKHGFPEGLQQTELSSANMSKDRFHSHFTTDLCNLPKLMEIQPTIHFPSSHGIRTSVARGQLLCFYPARIFPGATPVSELPLGDQLLTNEYENVYLDGGTPCCANTGFIK